MIISFTQIAMWTRLKKKLLFLKSHCLIMQIM